MTLQQALLRIAMLIEKDDPYLRNLVDADKRGERGMNIYKMYEPPKPVGWWILYAQATPHTRFGMYHKPSWIQRWFTNKLLGWTWEEIK